MTPLPLYRLQGNGDHFYTMSKAEADNAVATYGYTYEGVAGYLFADATEVAPLVAPLPAPYSMRDMFAASIVGQLAGQAIEGLRATGGGGTVAVKEACKVAAQELAAAQAATAYAYADALLSAREK